MSKVWIRMVKKEYTVISTFAGCGGSSLGYKWAGFKELLAIDFDKNACDTFRLNFDCEIWERDIKTVTGKEILDFCKIQKGELDILDGSPPCQGFSITNKKREITDNRNDLFLEFVRLINELQPKIFVMENVPGMIRGEMRGKFIEIMATLKKLNYNVKCKMLNAMWYEVPQSRNRLFFIGIRKDLGMIPIYPKPFDRIITASQAINSIIDIGHIEYPTEIIMNLYDKIKRGKSLCDYFKTINKKQSYFNVKKIHPNKPINTITKTFSNSISGLLHWKEKRFLTINELKACSTYPESFKFIGKFKQQWARIGNSVMPKQLYHIAKILREEILDKYYGD